MRNTSWLTIAVRQHVTPYAFGDIFFNGDRVTGIEEKPKIIKYILAGIYVLRPEIFQLIPDDTYFGMDLLIKEMLRRELPVIKYDLREYWLDIGQPADYEQAQADAKEGRFAA
jgi:NDP-sugar pyrophosphorylase family protein